MSKQNSKQSNKPKWITVGSLTQRKPKGEKWTKEDGYNFKVAADVTLKQGQFLNVQDPRDTLKFLLEKGYIDESTYEQRLDKIPDFVKLDLVLAPPKDEA